MEQPIILSGSLRSRRHGSGASSAQSFPQSVCKKILVVDDEEAIRDVLSRMLSLMGYAVSVAKDGEEGLKVFMECPFDLVLTDLNMPGLDGWALASHIKEKSPQTPVVLITAEDKDGILRKLKESAVDHAIFKPFGLKDIQKMVGKILCDH